MFNKNLGKRINSQVMMATAADSMGDVITTGATIAQYYFFILQELILTDM